MTREFLKITANVFFVPKGGHYLKEYWRLYLSWAGSWTARPATLSTGKDLPLERARESTEGSGWAFLYCNPSTLHRSPALGPREPTMDYINDPLVLWLQPMRGPGRNQRTGESEAWVLMHLFPNLHPQLGLAASVDGSPSRYQ